MANHGGAAMKAAENQQPPPCKVCRKNSRLFCLMCQRYVYCNLDCAKKDRKAHNERASSPQKLNKRKKKSSPRNNSPRNEDHICLQFSQKLSDMFATAKDDGDESARECSDQSHQGQGAVGELAGERSEGRRDNEPSFEEIRDSCEERAKGESDGGCNEGRCDEESSSGNCPDSWEERSVEESVDSEKERCNEVALFEDAPDSLEELAEADPSNGRDGNDRHQGIGVFWGSLPEDIMVNLFCQWAQQTDWSREMKLFYQNFRKMALVCSNPPLLNLVTNHLLRSENERLAGPRPGDHATNLEELSLLQTVAENGLIQENTVYLSDNLRIVANGLDITVRIKEVISQNPRVVVLLNAHVAKGTRDDAVDYALDLAGHLANEIMDTFSTFHIDARSWGDGANGATTGPRPSNNWVEVHFQLQRRDVNRIMDVPEAFTVPIQENRCRGTPNRQEVYIMDEEPTEDEERNLCNQVCDSIDLFWSGLHVHRGVALEALLVARRLGEDLGQSVVTEDVLDRILTIRRRLPSLELAQEAPANDAPGLLREIMRNSMRFDSNPSGDITIPTGIHFLDALLCNIHGATSKP